ncbi:glycosyltransferase [Micrococcus sp.]|uniref:glycosyltransferase n=1 Tax=Micrococcus sp. TaxID=1271 RepID=UPI0026DB9FBC|nr:glycosyltransferase [Micrococcus sp.]MDO4239603.1 glycosyltransferase [Micrococcus sp.]
MSTESWIPRPADAPADPAGPRGPVVLLYGDVDLNVLDGSAVWLGSMAETWVAAGAEVHVQLKAQERRDVLTSGLRALAGVTLHEARPEAGSDQMDRPRAVQVLEELAERVHPDVVMVRGIHLCAEAARRGAFPGRLWSYVTELGYPATSAVPAGLETVRTIAAASRVMLAQTEDARAVLEAYVPEAAGRTLVLTPMIPDALVASAAQARAHGDAAAHSDAGRPLELVYTGKFARAWRTDLMPALVPALGAHGVAAHLTMVGDKVHREKADPAFHGRMTDLMQAPDPAVTWTGGVPRSAALDHTARADVALSWRSPALDVSLEMSTKVLESCALGVPPVLNRTAAHERLLGADWPLFVDPHTDSVEGVARLLAQARPHLGSLAERAVAAAAPYRVSARAEVLRGYVARVVPGFGPDAAPAADPAADGGRPLRVVVAGHDLKFAGELLDLLRAHPRVDLRIDAWETLHRHDESASRAHAAWADVVLCEWAGPNAVWYARHKRPGQRLVVRLHMFELRGAWLQDLDLDAVDTLVTVSDHYRDLTVEALGADPARVRVIPNAVSVADLSREPVAGAEFRLGLVGIVPLRKRLDRALDLLRALRAEDDRFTLHVRGRMPWEYRHEWHKPLQREGYLDLFARLGGDPLHRAVAFEPFGADMGTWLRRMGWVLSPSSVESFHLAPAEGMAAGAIPVIWDRPGAAGVFGADLVHADTDAAARWILELTQDAARRQEWSERMRERVLAFDERTVARAWAQALGLD